jgi:selenocysteine lyase/cysteine desulfurase
VKKRLLTNLVPSVPGGGTVFYVTDTHHRYLENLEEREEAGTPNILGAIRAGLAFHVKESVGVGLIRRREDQVVAAAFEQWGRVPNLHILGPGLETSRLPVRTAACGARSIANLQACRLTRPLTLLGLV